ncbi:MAG: hypothetical protein ACW981_19925 [Candidatus Hodarchaeales archaeon]
MINHSSRKLFFLLSVPVILITSMLSVQPVISQTELTEEYKMKFTEGSI